MTDWQPVLFPGDTDEQYHLIGGLATIEDEDIELRFPCPHCKNEIETDIITVPHPRMAADVDRESRVYVSDSITCPNCEEEITIDINNGFGGVDIDIDDVSKNDIWYKPK